MVRLFSGRHRPSISKNCQKHNWLCKFTCCKGDNGEHYWNFGWRKDCKSCGASKGVAHSKNVERGPPRATGGGRGGDKQTERIKQLEEQVRKLQSEKDAQVSPVAESGTAANTGEPAAEADAEMATLRADIEKLESIEGPDELLQQVLKNKQERLETLRLERQAARPVHQQLRDVQAKLDRKEKAVQRRFDTDLPKLRLAAQASQKKVDEAEAEVKELHASIEVLKKEKERLLGQDIEGVKPAEKVVALIGKIKGLLDGEGAAPFIQHIEQLEAEVLKYDAPQEASRAMDFEDMDAEDEHELDALLGAATSEDSAAANTSAADRGKRKEALIAFSKKLKGKQQRKRHVGRVE